MNTLLEYLYYIYAQWMRVFSNDVCDAVLRLLGVVFVFTKISAAIVNDIDSSDDYGLVKGLAQMKDTTDFRFTKFLDIRFDSDKNTFDTGDTIHSGVDKDPKEIQNHAKLARNLNPQDPLEAENNHNKYLSKRLESLTYQIQNLSELLIEMNGQIRKNISHLSENQISVVKDIQNVRFSISKSSNGVTYYNGLYPRTETGSTEDNQSVNIPADCKEVQNRGNNISGVYQIQPKLSSKSFLVLCDMETSGGGWTHIQKRFDGSQDFYLGWREYKFGFGDLDGEFWLGLENIYFLTSVSVELLIELVTLDQKTSYAHFGFFKIGPEPDGYPLTNLTGFSGDAGDYLSYHIGQKFTTRDLDQDEYDTNCAEECLGAWWYKACYGSNLNAKRINLKLYGQNVNTGPQWGNWLSKTRMLVRQTSV